MLFTEAELKEQLRNMVRAYRHNHFHSDDMEFEEDKKHWADQAKLAYDTFNTMFADRFTTAVLLSDKPSRSIVKTLLGWARDSRPTHDIDRHTVKDSLKDCSNLLMRLTSVHGDAQGPAIWPYIKKIRYVVRSLSPSQRKVLITLDGSVFLNAFILSKGLVLVDLPGMYCYISLSKPFTPCHVTL